MFINAVKLMSILNGLVQLVKKYERGDLPKSDWLDNLTFRKMEEIHAVRSILCILPEVASG